MNSEIPPLKPQTGSSAKALAIISAVMMPLMFCLLPLRKLLGPYSSDQVALVLITIGVICGVLALLIRKGRPGVLVPAIIGLTLCGLMLAIFVTNYAAVKNKQEEAAAQEAAAREQSAP